MYMTVEEVVAVAERGRLAGATECLFTLGDRLEARYAEAAEALRSLPGGPFASTTAYVAHCASEARSISHWSPYDRVGVVNADP